MAAKAQIDTPAKWCQNRARQGSRKCALTALCGVLSVNDVANDWDELRAAEAYQLLSMACGGADAKDGWVAYFNDTQPHHTVMAAFDRAILAAT
jgi:hypothetical protein